MAAERCGICHRRLTDPASIAMGIGPECRSKLSKCGWHYRKPTYQVRRGKVELVSVSAMVPPPIGKVPPAMKHIDRQAREWLERETMTDEKSEIVKRVLSAGGSVRRAVDALHDYMQEKDSPMSRTWCEWFVAMVIKEMKDE